MKQPPRVFIVEGLDRLGKSTLIDNIQDSLGLYQVIHNSKPKVLSCLHAASLYGPLHAYQTRAYRNMFTIMSGPGKFIFDRAHLGEMVYAPLYRGYSGGYVFYMEDEFNIAEQFDIRMILLVEDFTCSNHFQDDGLSIDPTKRQQEQNLFFDAFNKSKIVDKRIICVTDKDTGKFHSPYHILQKALV
jgi:hypothetical protein